MQRMQRGGVGGQQQAQHRGYGGNGGGNAMSQGQGRQKKTRSGYGGNGRNEVRGQYQRKVREKKNHGRLHDARVNAGIMGRAHNHQHHSMPPQRRGMRGYSVGNDVYGPNGGQQMQNGQSPQGGQQ